MRKPFDYAPLVEAFRVKCAEFFEQGGMDARLSHHSSIRGVPETYAFEAEGKTYATLALTWEQGTSLGGASDPDSVRVGLFFEGLGRMADFKISPHHGEGIPAKMAVEQAFDGVFQPDVHML